MPTFRRAVPSSVTLKGDRKGRPYAEIRKIVCEEFWNFSQKTRTAYSPDARGFGVASIRIFSQKSKIVGAAFMTPDDAGSMNRTPTNRDFRRCSKKIFPSGILP
jgi:hypothetical protein